LLHVLVQDAPAAGAGDGCLEELEANVIQATIAAQCNDAGNILVIQPFRLQDAVPRRQCIGNGPDVLEEHVNPRHAPRGEVILARGYLGARRRVAIDDVLACDELDTRRELREDLALAAASTQAMPRVHVLLVRQLPLVDFVGFIERFRGERVGKRHHVIIALAHGFHEKVRDVFHVGTLEYVRELAHALHELDDLVLVEGGLALERVCGLPVLHADGIQGPIPRIGRELVQLGGFVLWMPPTSLARRDDLDEGSTGSLERVDDLADEVRVIIRVRRGEKPAADAEKRHALHDVLLHADLARDQLAIRPGRGRREWWRGAAFLNAGIHERLVIVINAQEIIIRGSFQHFIQCYPLFFFWHVIPLRAAWRCNAASGQRRVSCSVIGASQHTLQWQGYSRFPWRYPP